MICVDLCNLTGLNWIASGWARLDATNGFFGWTGLASPMRSARANVSYKERAERLKKHCLEETEASIAIKLARGKFAATFFLASLAEIGCDTVRLEDV